MAAIGAGFRTVTGKEVREMGDEEIFIRVDKEGRLTPPPELMARYGVKPGTKIRTEQTEKGFFMFHSAHNLAKLYIEPTNRCNLDCRTCIRNTWDEPMGMMTEEIFTRVLEGLDAFAPLPTVFFGGFGEPLFHPKILDMVARGKSRGAKVELITNATLLTPETARGLIQAGLNRLWVSLDGSTPESYADIRLGAALPKVLDNLKHFHRILRQINEATGCCGPVTKMNTQLGIVFVAMKRNINDLPAVIHIGQGYGAQHFMVTNVLAYTPELMNEALYHRTLGGNFGDLSLPALDINEITRASIYQVLRNTGLKPKGNGGGSLLNHCPFVETGAGAISWEGNLSPCLPLLHNYTSYMSYLADNGKRLSRRWAIGNILERGLNELWNTPEHLVFRERLQNHEFPVCINCSGCDVSATNENDCLGNSFPTCGGCLWAQGILQCP